jgi:hypothetical protein
MSTAGIESMANQCLVKAQCMWHSTTNVGMGIAKDSKGNVYVVGRYSPPGNWSGQKPY